MVEDSSATEDQRNAWRRAALDYHEFPRPGKLAITATKKMITRHDLSLAYSPGVAVPCQEIARDPTRPRASRPAATWSVSSPTAAPCLAWATSDRWRLSR